MTITKDERKKNKESHTFLVTFVRSWFDLSDNFLSFANLPRKILSEKFSICFTFSSLMIKIEITIQELIDVWYIV